MGTRNSRSLRTANTEVRFDLYSFERKLASLFGAEVDDSGFQPGPRGLKWSVYPTCNQQRAVGYLFEELFSKFDDGNASSKEARWVNCLRRFYEAEESCRDTNWRFSETSFLYRGSTSSRYSVGRVFFLARRKIERLLGPYLVTKVEEGVGFGPGATTRLSRVVADLGYKLGGSPHGTISAIFPALQIMERTCPKWMQSFFDRDAKGRVVQGNKIVGVPKNYKTDRMIAIEPDLNMFCQKGIGQYIRQRLVTVGVDLSTQELNAFAAGVGSITGELATIDLSMASDCVATALVEYLLPPDWTHVLKQVRSPEGRFASGEVVEYQKFSSMGNGFTFELESLIFWALCSAVLDLMRQKDRRLLVYGDDLVVPTYAYSNIVEVLTYAGFTPNAKKSFASGDFRESCGSHFLGGDDVTPIYVREPITRLDRLFLLHNNCARLLRRFEQFVVATPEEVQEFFVWLRSHAPDNWRKPRLPRLDVGDGAFYGSFEECTPRKARCGWEGYRVKTLQPVASYRAPKSAVPYDALLKSLWLAEARAGGSPGTGNLLHSDEVASDQNRWKQSEQIVPTLATDYCWWHCL